MMMTEKMTISVPKDIAKKLRNEREKSGMPISRQLVNAYKEKG